MSRGEPVLMPNKPDAQAQRDDADVLDAVIRQQPFQVVLRQRKQHAEHTRSQPDANEHPAPPQRRRAQKRERAQQSINARLDHHARHQRRNVARRGGMRFRQPDVKRHEAGLRAEPDDRQQKQKSGQTGV